MQLVFVPDSVGLEPEVMLGMYVSVPGVVVERTVYVAEPALVICGFDVSKVVDAGPLVCVKVTEKVPVPVALPRTSRTFTVAVDVADASGGIEVGEKAQLRWSPPPAVQLSVSVVLVRPGDESVITHPL